MIDLKNVDMSLDKEVLENGLIIYVLKNKNSKKYNASFFTRFGDLISSFDDGSGEYQIPYGTAHFLEHKLFAQEDETIPFKFFSNNGADSNAFTSKIVTNYLFEGTAKFEENLLYLLSYVGSPYFTNENVEKEKGIILQELKRSEDDIFNSIYYKLQENIFNKSGYKYPILGTKETINSITKEDLYKCYNNFYAPNNMTLFVSGNIDLKDVVDIVKKSNYSTLKRVDFSFNLEEEPKEIILDNMTINKDIHVPIVNVIFKHKIKDVDKDKLEFYLNLHSNGTFDSINYNIEKLFDKDILTKKYLDNDVYVLGDYIMLEISGSSKKAAELINFIKEEVKNNLSKEDFELQRKKMLAMYLYLSDKNDNFHYYILNNIIKKNKYLDIYELLDNINYDEYLEYINKIDFSYTSSLIADCKNS